MKIKKWTELKSQDLADMIVCVIDPHCVSMANQINYNSTIEELLEFLESEKQREHSISFYK